MISSSSSRADKVVDNNNFSQHFPTNLHILLDEAEMKGNNHYSNIISWCSEGQAFKIHDQDALVPLLAKYFTFRPTKFISFLLQLQSYDFHRLTTRGIGNK